jgi:hypothetical protein
MYEIFFKYDDSWNELEILELVQIIQRILGLKESLSVERTLNSEMIIPVRVDSNEDIQKLLDKINKTVMMAEPYKIEYRKQ